LARTPLGSVWRLWRVFGTRSENGKETTFRAFFTVNALELFRMSTPLFAELRRSTRVPLEVSITIGKESVTVSGVTVVVNLHGALIRSSREFEIGTELLVVVYLTGKSSRARVAYHMPANRLVCGIELEVPQNIWGVSLIPDDWYERIQ
jgi:hypothetical protein